MSALPAITARVLGAATALAAALGAQGGPRVLTPAQMQEDLFTLSDALERGHAGLLRYATREELDEAFGAALFAVEEELDLSTFHRTVAGLIARVRCGHTRARLTEPDEAAVLASKGLLPLEVCLRGERAWVRRVLADDVPLAPLAPGAELRAIDGWTIAALRERAFARMSGDGFVETGKERELEQGFAVLFATLVDEGTRPAPARIEVAGEAEAVRVARLTPAEHARAVGPRPPRALIELELRPEHDAGVLAVSVFGDRAQESFPDLLQAAFRDLRTRDVARLVLDLRGNGGGRDEYGALLVSYLTTEPFGYFERIEVTPDYTPPDDYAADVVERDGRRLVTSHPGLRVQAPSPLAFTGDVWILTDGWTFSTAADVATVAHHNGLARFAGEETGGGYDGNTSGDSRSVTLPHSRITVGVPQWMYTTANAGHEHRGRGVPPDVRVQSSIEDVLAGRDAVLERVLAP